MSKVIKTSAHHEGPIVAAEITTEMLNGQKHYGFKMQVEFAIELARQLLDAAGKVTQIEGLEDA